MPDPDASSPDDPLRRLRERLTRLEESQAFAERHDDAFNEQLVALERRLHELLSRLARLEARLDQFGESPDQE
ncbi:hypothetical protein PHYC_03994 [Phycisphaerales bacterium]|nr:hypothetical protein PHYC_03994 [Phycisphaerales bacterium]